MDKVTEPRVQQQRTLSDRAIAVMAVASAISVANGYYIQPLLVDIGREFGISEHYLGFLPAMTQMGLACGLALLLPLGDVVSARTLLVYVIPLQIIALVLVTVSGHEIILFFACLMLGVFGLAPYVLPPYASLLVESGRIGHVTGMLTRGVIVGLLVARTVAGVVGTHFGWRTVYGIAAVVMVGVLLVLMRIVRPIRTPQHQAGMSYAELTLSLVHLFRAEPKLRTAAFCQALSFGSFNVFWLGSSLYLQSDRFGWSPQSVGLVAMVGAAAAIAAPVFGRAADRNGAGVVRVAALSAMALAWVLFTLFQAHLAGMAIGLIVLDIGASVADISNRTILYGLEPAIRTRLNALYTIAMFLGASCMSALVGICWGVGGWPAICVLGFFPIALALASAWRAMRD